GLRIQSRKGCGFKSLLSHWQRVTSTACLLPAPIIRRRCLKSASSGDRVASCGTRPECFRSCCKDQLSFHTDNASMANLAQKNGTWLVRFRFLGKEFKRSLKTSNEREATAAQHAVEWTIHRLETGQLQLP